MHGALAGVEPRGWENLLRGRVIVKKETWCIPAGLLMAGVCLAALAQDIERIVQEAEPAAVMIVGLREDSGARVQSSGCSVHPAGYVLSTAHQIDGVGSLEAIFANGKRFPLEVVALDTERELSLLKTSESLSHHARIGNADTLRGGAPLLSIATPADLSFSVVRGMVSSVNRTYHGYPVFQAEMTAAPGSSGGPVFDRYGNLVGLIIGKLADQEAFAIINPINNAYELLREHGIIRAVPAPGEAVLLVPAPGASAPERDAVEAYNAGVGAPDPAAKVRAYARAVELMPEFFEAWFNRAVAYTELEEWAAAEAAYVEAAALRPDAVQVKRNLGRLFLRTGRPREAAQEFEEAVGLAPEEAQSHNDLGEALRQAGEHAAAAAAFERALEIRPAYPQARYNLALVLALDGHTERAVQEFRAYLALDPDASDRARVERMIDALLEQSGAALPPGK